MTAKALGIIETIGLTAAIEAADAAAKAANVTVLGYENARGGGRITVKLVGDVGAVKAAVSAGSAAAMRVGKIAGCVVIPRPHDEIAALIAQIDRGRMRRLVQAPAVSELIIVAAEQTSADAIRDPADAIRDPADAIRDPADAIRDPADAIRDPADAIRDPADAIGGPSDEPAPEAEPSKPPVKRGKARKNEPPTPQDPGEVEG